MSGAPRDPMEVVRALFVQGENGQSGPLDLRHVDALMADHFVNHAAGPQGRDGWKSTISTIDADLGPLTVEHHHFVVNGQFVAHHMTMHGRHRGSMMPLLAGRLPTGRSVSWRFMHLWRVDEGLVVEHWACRDDLALLAQIEQPPGS